MEEDEDKDQTVVQTKRDKQKLARELLGDDYEDDAESDTEFDITRID